MRFIILLTIIKWIINLTTSIYMNSKSFENNGLDHEI